MKRERCRLHDCYPGAAGVPVYELTAFYEGGGAEVFRVPAGDVDAAVAALEELPDLVSVSIREDT